MIESFFKVLLGMISEKKDGGEKLLRFPHRAKDRGWNV